jgi:hypothetical protein
MDKHERPYRCTNNECNNVRGFTSKGDLKRHNRNAHKFYSGQASMLFCDEPDCPRGPGGGTAGFNRKDNLADHMRRKHGRTSTASARVIGSVGGANTMTLPSIDLESPQSMGIELAASPQRKRRRMPEMGFSSQSEDLEDMEEMNLRQELKRMRQVERDMENELTKTKQRVEELIKELKEAQLSLFSGMDIFDGYELGKIG